MNAPSQPVNAIDMKRWFTAPVWYALCIFLGAFLLFLVQPLIGKAILPRFGSSASIWVASLLFFQVALLAGYAYAHLLSVWLPQRAQVQLHCGLLFLSLLMLPIVPRVDLAATGGGDPTLDIVLLLAVTVGLPYLVLSSTSPLLQRWYSMGEGVGSPYRLYAVSNAGSLLALLAYPLLLEPKAGVKAQAWLWSGLFVFFVLLSVVIARRAGDRLNAVSAQLEDATATRPGWNRLGFWLLLSALPSCLLVSTTTRLSQDLPAVPFLFVVPLAVYLLTFIITFDSPRWYLRPVFGALLLVSLSALLWTLLQRAENLGLHLLLISLGLFSCSMCCHGELARSKPPAAQLTTFYLAVACGGAVGGFLVALVAPLVFDDYLEYELTLVAVAASISMIYLRGIWRWRQQRTGRGHPRLGAILSGAVALLAGLAFWLPLQADRELKREGLVASERSFYSVLKVFVRGDYSSADRGLFLFHGNTLHGFQYTHPARMRRTSTYYGPTSGVGQAILKHPGYGRVDEEFRLGVVGLGVGTLAAYGNSPFKFRKSGQQVDDSVVFYEIDKAVWDIADNQFSYLQLARNRGTNVQVLLGDARIVMERQAAGGAPQRFDVLAVDAFTGDSLPMHLLTREAIEVYRGHLRQGGILAFHISNRHLDLLPLMRSLGRDADMNVAFYNAPGDIYKHKPSSWVLLTNNADFLANPSIGEHIVDTDHPDFDAWTDDYSALLPLVKRHGSRDSGTQP